MPAPVDAGDYDRWLQSLPTSDAMSVGLATWSELAALVPTIDFSSVPPGPMPAGWSGVVSAPPTETDE